MIQKKRVVLMFLCVMASALAANGQTTKVVEVVLECPNMPNEITVIVDGEPIAATRIAGTNRWSGDRGRPFSANGRIGSVRVSGGRTGCARSRAYRKPGTDQWVAELTFPCLSQRKVWPKLHLETDPADLPVTYARVMPGSLKCDEKALIEGTGFLADIAPGKEMVYLHLGTVPRFYELYFLRVAPGGFRKRLEEGTSVTLRSNDLLDDLALRRGRNGPNWRDLTRKDLDQTGFKNIVLKVQ
jgi:hypothetical protein